MPKFLPYVLRSIVRNKVRTVLTLFGLMVAVGIFCFLVSIETSMDQHDRPGGGELPAGRHAEGPVVTHR